ncbi:hypothetical protein, partial [Mobiluncus curtisii]|uniref:hypothetical protein n=1 Tax=Mobiluncus curtisii TaxID=2051 RepID=UPI0021E30540
RPQVGASGAVRHKCGTRRVLSVPAGVLAGEPGSVPPGEPGSAPVRGAVQAAARVGARMCPGR